MGFLTENWVQKWRELQQRNKGEDESMVSQLLKMVRDFNDYVEEKDAAYQEAQRKMEAKAKKYMDKLRKDGKTNH